MAERQNAEYAPGAAERAREHAVMLQLSKESAKAVLTRECTDCAWLIDHGYGRPGEKPRIPQIDSSGAEDA
jgi:hypothetical protein